MIYYAWLTWMVPLLAVPFVPLAARLDGRLRGPVAVLASGLSLAFSTLLALGFQTSTVEQFGPFLPYLGTFLQVDVDGLSVLVSVFVAFVSFLVLVYSLGYMKDEPGQSRYYSLVLLFVGSMLGLVMAGNLVQFYFFWELMGVCSALLIAFWTDRPAARQAGLKAFIVTRLGDTALLVAVLTVFALFGTTSFDFLLGPGGVATLGGGTALVVGVLLLLGAMGKSAQVPLHVWLPDAMEGPTTVSALIHAATMVNAGVFLLLRMYPLITLPQLQGSLSSLVLAVGLVSALLGGASASAADDLKRVLAYSTISQLGLMFAAIGLGGMDAAAYHMVSQGLFKALAFLAAGSVVTALGTRDLAGMGGLARTMKVTYLGFLVSVLAMSGLPPLVGFWSKDAILALAFQAGPVQSAATLGVIGFTALYSFRALFRVFHGPPRSSSTPTESPPSMLGPIVVLAASVLAAWALLQSQTLLSFTSFWSLDLNSVASSLVILGAASVAAYVVCVRSRPEAVAVLQGSAVLRGLRGALFDGFYFDRAYQAAYGGVIVPASKVASRIQTEGLRANAGLALLTVLAVLVLFAAGVL